MIRMHSRIYFLPEYIYFLLEILFAKLMNGVYELFSHFEWPTWRGGVSGREFYSFALNKVKTPFIDESTIF